MAGPQGVLDYAGGIVIHTSSGVSSLVVAHMLQSRRAFKQEIDDSTHNIPLTLVGVSLVWVGWYSFNGGSGLKANGQAAGALCVTQISACTASKSQSWRHLEITVITNNNIAQFKGFKMAPQIVI